MRRSKESLDSGNLEPKLGRIAPAALSARQQAHR